MFLSDFIELVSVLGTGLALGSFATVLIYRIPSDLPWGTFDSEDRRSFCPHCRHSLSVIDLVPVLSWLLNHGRCRYCTDKIPLLYPFAEILSLAACLGIYFSWGFTFNAFILMAAVPFLTALIFIDIQKMILPNVLNLITGVIALIFLGWNFYLAEADERAFYALGNHLAAGVIYPLSLLILGIITQFFLKKETIGGGDIKFFAVAGLFLGLGVLPVFMVIGGVLGVVIGTAQFFMKKKGIFPFGPALVASLYLCLIFQGLNTEFLPMFIDPIYGISQY